jgi:hypothetical protein
MDDYDGIKKFNGLKYSPFENFDTFWFIIFYGDQNTKPFSSCVIHLKGFPPCQHDVIVGFQWHKQSFPY